MKKIMIQTIAFLFALNLFAQTENQGFENYNMSNQRWNLGLSMKGSSIDSKAAAWLGVNASYKISDKIELGLKAEGLSYDRKLNELDKDKSYHLQAGHAGVFLDWHPFGIGDYHFSLPIYMGTGEISYIYDRKYRKDMKWADEIIDKDLFAVWQLGAEFEARFYNHWSLTINCDYRASSPIKMLGAEEDILNNFNAGISFKYNFFD